MIFLPSRFARSSSTHPSQRSRVWYGACADALPSRDQVESAFKSECRSTAIHGQDTTWSRFPSLNFPCRGNCIKFPLSFLVLADSLAPDGAFLKHSYQDFHSTTALQVNYYSRQSTPESLSYRLIISGRLVIPSVVPLKSSPSRLFIAEYLVPPEHPWHFRWSPLGRDTINTGSGTRGPRFLRAVLHCNS